MSLLLLRCYILHLLIFCVSLLFFALGFCFVSCVSFCLCRLFCALVVASPHLSLLYCDWVWLADGREVFLGDGGWVGGGRLMPEAHCAFHLRLRGGGCAHALAREGKRQQRSRGRHSSTEDGASWLKKEKELQIFLAGSRDLVARTAQRTAQVGSRRKKIADFPGRQQGFRGRHSTEDGASWLKKEKKCRFRGRHSKEAKDSKVLFYFWFLDWVHLVFSREKWF